MLNRNVMFPDGTILDCHEVDNILHIAEAATHIEVVSYKDGEKSAARHTPLVFDLDDSIGFDAAYELVANHPMFAEYIDPAQAALDEVLPILTDEQAEQVIDVFPAWQVGKAYEVGVRVRYESILYKCIQAHTSQADWTPDTAVSLWVRVGEPGEIPEWVQPTGAHDAYAKGDKVLHGGKVWTSDIDANVYEPGVYGWTETN
ncbi:MAG: hypothetical protein IKB96_03860 [Prevotella sp.]|nr:hypothetical protein [Prevotella sp.]